MKRSLKTNEGNDKVWRTINLSTAGRLTQRKNSNIMIAETNERRTAMTIATMNINTACEKQQKERACKECAVVMPLWMCDTDAKIPGFWET